MRAHRRVVTAIVAVAVLASGLLVQTPAAPAWAAGNFALRFNGDPAVDANVVATTAAPLLTNSFTVSADVRWDGTSGYRAVVSMPHIDAPAGSSSGMALGLNDGAPFLALKDTTLVGRVLVATTPLAIGQWFTVTATYDGQFSRIYVDGVLEATQDFGSFGNMTPTNGTILIGREFAKSTDPNLNARGFHGEVDKVAISSGLYPAALTPIASYLFSEGAGLTTADDGPSGYTGTLSAVSTPEWVQGSDPIALTYQSTPTGATATTSVRPYTPIVYGGATTFARSGYTLTGWTNLSTLAIVSPGDPGVKGLAPETFEAVWTAGALAATGMDESAGWRSLLAMAILGVGCGLVFAARRRSAWLRFSGE
jgi:hypothetical protein